MKTFQGRSSSTRNYEYCEAGIRQITGYNISRILASLRFIHKSLYYIYFVQDWQQYCWLFHLNTINSRSDVCMCSYEAKPWGIFQYKVLQNG